MEGEAETLRREWRKRQRGRCKSEILEQRGRLDLNMRGGESHSRSTDMGNRNRYRQGETRTWRDTEMGRKVEADKRDRNGKRD